MASVHEVGQAALAPLNGSSEIERLTALVGQLQVECEKLRHALAKSESERRGYRKALYEHARAAREFEDVDVACLEKMSAGLVEAIE